MANAVPNSNVTITPSPESLKALTQAATAEVTSMFALQHFQTAKLLRDQVVKIEEINKRSEVAAFFEEIRSYCSASIITSAASLEALINELFISPIFQLRSTQKDFETWFFGSADGKKNGFEQKQILSKYQTALRLMNKPELNTNDDFFIDAKNLIDFRNALIHFKPIWDIKTARIIRLEDSLKDRFALSPFVDDGADFISMRCMSSGCAIWAVETVSKFVEKFSIESNISDKKLTMFR